MVGIMPKKTKKVAKKSASKAAEPKKEVITAEALSMEFCEKCGSLMLPQKNSMKCRRCGASKRGTVTGLKIVTGRKKIKGIPVLEKDETPLPQMGMPCPECPNKNAYWWMQQTRGADEPPTQFFRCTKCSYVWREYK